MSLNGALQAVKKRPSISLALLGVFLLAALSGVYLQARRMAADRVEAFLGAQAETYTVRFERLIEAPRLVPAALSLVPAVHDLLVRADPHSAQELSAMLEQLTRTAGVEAIFLMDRYGSVLASSNWRAPETFVGRNFAFRPYFQDALAGRVGHYTAKGTVLGSGGHYLASPVAADGKVLGAVVVRISVDVIDAILSAAWREEGRIDLVSDGHGVIVATPIDTLRYKAIQPLAKETREAIEASHQYGIDAGQPALSEGAAMTGGLRRIRFADDPGREYLQKSFDVPGSGFRLYLHTPVRHYWLEVAEFAAMFTLAVLVALLLLVNLYFRWAHADDLIQAALRDPLTGLNTRLYMKDWCEGAVSAHNRDPGTGFGLVVFDLDLFKKINDVYGHLAGDAVLRGVGEIVRSTIRGNDLAVRFGGEEIAVFARCANLAEATALAERIRQRVVQTEFAASTVRMPVTLSGGVAYHEAGETLDALFARADAKLYEAKKLGRNRIVS
jgi:diguanylate cyclase (GGDEF)-like protein